MFRVELLSVVFG